MTYQWFMNVLSLLIALCLFAAHPFGAVADSVVIPQEIQRGVNPEKAAETLKNIFQLSPAPVQLKSSPVLQQNLQQIRSGTEMFLNIDAGIRNLNAQIKETIGLDIPVFVGAIWRGVVWLINFVYSLFVSLIPSF